MVARARYRDTATTGMKISEYLVMILVVALVVAGGRYYFLVYRHSPGYMVGQYLAAVKRGDAAAQYALIDDEDKRLWFPTEDTYTKQAKQANGYVERISSVTLAHEQIDPKKSNLASVDATIVVRKAGQKIYESDTETFTDHYTLRKDSDGNWKIWLKESQINMLRAEPTPPGQPL
jgi:hypothetical protein